MIKNIVLASAATVAFATPAMAQEPGDYSGFRVEALVGYDRVAGDFDEDFEAEIGEDIEGEHSSGVLYGAAVGYDFAAAGGFLIGVDAELSDSSVGESYEFDEVDLDGYIVDGTIDLDAARDLYVGGRIGSAFSANVFYVKAGYSMARFEVDAEGTIDGEAGALTADLDVEGLRLGAGVERQFGRNTFAKIEYRFTNYGQAEGDYEGEEVDLDAIFDVIDLDRHQVAVGFGYRF